MRQAVFLGRDGTLIRDLHHAPDPARIEILPGVVEGLKRLAAQGYLLVVVTNQSGVARGYYTLHDVEKLNSALDRALRSEGTRVRSFYFCPHHPHGTIAGFAGLCMCRKPRPGLLLRAASDLDIDLRASWLIGDAACDISAGRAAGCRTALIGHGGGNAAAADVVARSLADAASAILGAAEVSPAVAT